MDCSSSVSVRASGAAAERSTGRAAAFVALQVAEGCHIAPPDAAGGGEGGDAAPPQPATALRVGDAGTGAALALAAGDAYAWQRVLYPRAREVDGSTQAYEGLVVLMSLGEVGGGGAGRSVDAALAYGACAAGGGACSGAKRFGGPAEGEGAHVLTDIPLEEVTSLEEWVLASVPRSIVYPGAKLPADHTYPAHPLAEKEEYFECSDGVIESAGFVDAEGRVAVAVSLSLDPKCHVYGQPRCGLCDFSDQCQQALSPQELLCPAHCEPSFAGGGECPSSEQCMKPTQLRVNTDPATGIESTRWSIRYPASFKSFAEPCYSGPPWDRTYDRDDYEGVVTVTAVLPEASIYAAGMELDLDFAYGVCSKLGCFSDFIMDVNARALTVRLNHTDSLVEASFLSMPAYDPSALSLYTETGGISVQNNGTTAGEPCPGVRDMGMIMSNPAVIGVFVTLLLLMALQMWGLLSLEVPMWLKSKLIWGKKTARSKAALSNCPSTRRKTWIEIPEEVPLMMSKKDPEEKQGALFYDNPAHDHKRGDSSASSTHFTVNPIATQGVSQMSAEETPEPKAAKVVSFKADEPRGSKECACCDPEAAVKKAANEKPLTYAGAFWRGIVFGLVQSPCTGPFAASLLLQVAVTGDMFLGFVALFIFAFGNSTLLLIVSISSGLAAQMPEPGPWLATLKSHSGFVVVIMACFFLSNLGDMVLTAVGLTLSFASWIIFTIVTGIFTNTPMDELPLDKMMAVEASRPHAWMRKLPILIPREIERPVKHYGFLAAMVGLQLAAYFFLWSWAITGDLGWDDPDALVREPPSDIMWYSDFSQAVTLGNERSHALFVKFGGDACLNCAVMDRTVFGPGSRVSQSINEDGFVAVKLDATEYSFLKDDHWGVVGLPAYVFVTADSLAAAVAVDGTAALPPRDHVIRGKTGEGTLVESLDAIAKGEIPAQDDECGGDDSAQWARMLGLAYPWGLLASLSPCCYPMIPATIALFAGARSRASVGDRSQQSAKRRAVIGKALVYTLAMCLLYAFLGLLVTLAFN